MNHTIIDPIEADKHIQRLQISLYEQLAWIDFELFGRIHKNKLEGGFVPQYFENGKYRKDVYLDTKKSAIAFFVIGNDYEVLPIHIIRNTVKIVFMVNLIKLFPLITGHRAELEVRQLVYSIVSKDTMFKITNMHVEVDNVLDDFNTSKMQSFDIHPWHTFSIETQLQYKQQLTC